MLAEQSQQGRAFGAMRWVDAADEGDVGPFPRRERW